MKRIQKWQRIFLLALLCLSVSAPIFLVSYRLKTLALEGAKDFIEDLSSIKIRADSLKLSALEQEDGQGLKEPKEQVYRDQYISITTSYSSNESLKDKHTDRDLIRITSVDRKESDDGIEEHVNIHTKEEEAPSNLTKEQQSDIGVNQSVISTTARRTQNSHDPSMQIPGPANEKVKKLKDQLIRATAYLSLATENNNVHLVKELKQRIKEVERGLGDATKDSELKKSAFPKMRIMESTLSKANRVYPDCPTMVQRLQEMAESTYEQIQEQKNQTKSLIQIAGRTTPKGLHCLSMKLTTEYFSVPFQEREPVNQLNFHNPDLFHYVIFSDNVLACAVVVNSTVSAAKEQERIVFHIVTDSINFPAISMWFLLNPPGQASIHVRSIESFKTLSTKYRPFIEPYTEMENYIDQRYSSPLNHLRFYLPELFPDLDKVLFLDHDVVVLKDLSDLWKVEMKGKVNAAVHTCHQDEPSFRRMDMLINFSDPWVDKEFDANSCTWAFGMNLFDLTEWRNQHLTAKYHKYLHMGFKRPLWTPRSLSLGWVTFYNHTFSLDRSWHVLGLGHSTAVKKEKIDQAAVIHYDGIMKPWLDIGIRRYKDYWAKYINFDHPYIHQCNINE